MNFLPGIQMQMRTSMAQMLAAEGMANVVTAKLHWRTVTRPEGYDRNDEDTAVGGTVVPGVKEFRTFFHEVDHRLSGFQRSLEVQTGDVIIDFMEDLELAGKDDLRVEVQGRYYVQKSASKGLLESWDVYMEYGGLMRTLLLTPAP